MLVGTSSFEVLGDIRSGTSGVFIPGVFIPGVFELMGKLGRWFVVWLICLKRHKAILRIFFSHKSIIHMSAGATPTLPRAIVSKIPLPFLLF